MTTRKPTPTQADTTQTVFVYGTLKRWFHNHEVLGDSQFLGTVSAKGWTMYDMGAYPGVRPGSPGDVVQGELYACSRATLARLDRLEGVPHHYRSEVVRVARKGCKAVEALMYVIQPQWVTERHNVVEGGVW